MYNQYHIKLSGGGDMEVRIVFVKLNGEERIEIPFEDMKKEEQQEQGIKLKKRFFETLGYAPKEKTA